MADDETLATFCGLDLGQMGDFSALVCIERRTGSGKPLHALRHIHRWPLGTPYPDIVAGTLAILADPRVKRPVLVPDQTGVGRPVVDLFRRGVSCRFQPVTITAGANPTRAADGLHIPKKDLVACLQLLLGTRRLAFAAGLPGLDVLKKELQNFRVKITTAGNETFSAWRENDKDDLVLAVALACWVGENTFTGPLPDPYSEASRLESLKAPAGVWLTDASPIGYGGAGEGSGDYWPR